MVLSDAGGNAKGRIVGGTHFENQFRDFKLPHFILHKDAEKFCSTTSLSQNIQIATLWPFWFVSVNPSSPVAINANLNVILVVHLLNKKLKMP